MLRAAGSLALAVVSIVLAPSPGRAADIDRTAVDLTTPAEKR